jgi:hypothetical protein
MRLADVLRNIGSRRCFHTGRGNFFTVEVVDEDGVRIDYSIYFKVSRGGPSRAGLVLFVESAYVRENIPLRRPRPRKPIRFSIIAYNTTMGKLINEPPG